MAGLKEPGTAGTSGCVVMFVHILVVGRQALVNHISILRFLSHVFFKASTELFYMYTGERDLTEVIRITATPSFYYHTIYKRTKQITPSAMRQGNYSPRCVRWREIAGLPRGNGCEVDCGCYRVILNSGLTPHAATTDRLRRGGSGP